MSNGGAVKTCSCTNWLPMVAASSRALTMKSRLATSAAGSRISSTEGDCVAKLVSGTFCPICHCPIAMDRGRRVKPRLCSNPFVWPTECLAPPDRTADCPATPAPCREASPVGRRRGAASRSTEIAVARPTASVPPANSACRAIRAISPAATPPAMRLAGPTGYYRAPLREMPDGFVAEPVRMRIAIEHVVGNVSRQVPCAMLAVEVGDRQIDKRQIAVMIVFASDDREADEVAPLHLRFARLDCRGFAVVDSPPTISCRWPPCCDSSHQETPLPQPA